MVLTRSMAAKLCIPNYTIEYTPNRYNPDTRISLVTEENIKNHAITLFDNFNIYNDIRYKANKNGGAIAHDDYRPLLYSIMGIFYNNIDKTIIKIKNAIAKNKDINTKNILTLLITQLVDIDIEFRQFGINNHFGDLNINNEQLDCFTHQQISYMYSQWLTYSDIKYMNLFKHLKKVYDEYIDILKSAIETNPFLNEYFSEELCINNFSKDSIYGYISNIKY
jgi:hypothetical protein